MFQGFLVECFIVLLISKNLAWFLSFISYPLVVVVHLESFIKQPFGLDFSIFQKTCFIIKTLSMYILPHFDVDFQILLLIKYNQLGLTVILLTVEVSH